MCGDSTSIDAVEKLMNKEQPDLIYTDPPYGINIVTNGQVGGGGAFGKGKKQKSKGKRIEANKYHEIIGDNSIDVALHAIQIIKSIKAKVQIIWGGNYYANALDNSNCWIVWDKQTGESTFADAELAWTNQSSKVRIFQHRWSGICKASEHGQKRVHPTQKPIVLAEWCFEIYGKNSRSVLDLFGGSGSTLIACEKTARDCRMMELDPKYCDVIIKRWQDFTGQEATNETTGKTFAETKSKMEGK
jgi:DNA modification methylase